jgi:flagellin-like hook-associated protein FlgL
LPSTATATATSPTSSPTATSASGPYDVYQPAQNWGLEDWRSDYPFKAGEVVFHEDGASSKIVELSDKVKGQWFGSTSVETGDFMLGTDGKWYKAQTSNSVEPNATNAAEWSAITDPLVEAGFGTEKTSEFQNPDSKYWVKTHFGHLVKNAGSDGNATGIETIKTDYERGDNIYHNGKHYIYVSNLPSNDPSFLSPKGDGYTELEDLISSGAVRETSLFVDTRGGGGSADLPSSVYYRPNQALEHIDRLPNSGLARANSITRRTDSMESPGDEIFNSADDLFHGGLDAGSDGIYGTADDFYASTTDRNIAKSGFHVDGDADNNKDLLNAKHNLNDFSVADFVDYIQSLANFRAVNGGTMSRLGYSQQMLEENEINLESAVSRIMDADMALEASKLARQNVLVQAGASMLVQSNQLTNVVLSLLQ